MVTSDSGEINALLLRAAAGEDAAVGELLGRYRDRLKRMVRVRLNRRLIGTVNDSDVLRAARSEVSRHLNEYLRERPLPLFLWLRGMTGQTLLRMQQSYLGEGYPEGEVEISLHHGKLPAANSMALAQQLLGRLSSPSQAGAMVEKRLKLQRALNELAPSDREILALRHFEQLTNDESSQVLGQDAAQTSRQYVRALMKLQGLLKDVGMVPNREPSAGDNRN